LGFFVVAPADDSHTQQVVLSVDIHHIYIRM